MNTITDKLIAELEQWQHIPLQAIYPVVWLDAIHYKIKVDGRYISQAMYTSSTSRCGFSARDYKLLDEAVLCRLSFAKSKSSNKS